MKKLQFLGLCAAAVVYSAAQAQVPPQGVTDPEAQMALIKDSDPKRAANKKLVFDMWRELIQGGHTEVAEKYFRQDYIQHNPNVATGRDAMVAFMKSTRPVKAVDPGINFPLITMMAEGDKVLVATVTHADDPEKPGQKYAGTHFDLFRIQDGKIAEHWDSVPKDPAMLHFNPNSQLDPAKH